MMKKYIVLNESIINEQLTLMRGVGKNDTGYLDLFGKGLYLTDSEPVAKFYGNAIERFKVNGTILDVEKDLEYDFLVELFRKFDQIYKTFQGRIYLKELKNIYDDGYKLDYIGLIQSVDSWEQFHKIAEKNNFNNQHYSAANIYSLMNNVLKQFNYVGLKYPTSEIEDLEDKGLGNESAYLIFDLSAIKKL